MTRQRGFEKDATWTPLADIHLALNFEDTMEEQEFVRLDDHSPVEILNECLGNLSDASLQAYI